MSFNVVWPNYFGRRYLASIRGLAMTVTVVASAFAFGPLPFGAVCDIWGGYTGIIVGMMVFVAAGVGSSMLAKNPNRASKSMAG